MASLNLTPNPVAVLTQAAIFAVNLIIVKKLMLNPFLRQKKIRDAATTGSQSDAKELIAASEQMTQEMTQRVQAAHAKIRVQVDEIKKTASAQRQKIVSQAESQAKAEVSEIQGAINKGLQDERAKLSESARVLAGQLLDRVLA